MRETGGRDARARLMVPRSAEPAMRIRFAVAWFFLAAIVVILSTPVPSLAQGMVLAGLSEDPVQVPDAPVQQTSDASSDVSTACAPGVTFSRNVRYTDDAGDLLDVATAQTDPDARRPILVFIGGEEFSGRRIEAAEDSLVEKAMCFAASNGLVAVRVSYRSAPPAAWPAGALDVAAAISWVFDNASLFGGNVQEIVPVGYGAGAFHLATYLCHKDFQVGDANIAGVVLMSGIYEPGGGTDESERTYFGANAGSSAGRSTIRCLTEIEQPIVLSWSLADAQRSVAQSQKLQSALCDAGHCPRTVVLGKPGTFASVFDLDGASADLHKRLRQLIGQLDARGLP